jgi:hypothetical protein
LENFPDADDAVSNTLNLAKGRQAAPYYFERVLTRFPSGHFGDNFQRREGSLIRGRWQPFFPVLAVILQVPFPLQ